MNICIRRQLQTSSDISSMLTSSIWDSYAFMGTPDAMKRAVQNDSSMHSVLSVLSGSSVEYPVLFILHL